jgi:hypothetical protein
MEMGEDELEMRWSWTVAEFLEKQKDDGGGRSIGLEFSQIVWLNLKKFDR